MMHWRKRVLVALLVSSLLAGLPGCSLDPTDLPVPGSYVAGESYRLKIEFSSVLNLPAKAKVDSGGIQVGVLDHVDLVGSTAVAYVDVSSGVALPRNTRAELRQATVLGDIYIAMISASEPAADTLGDGDTIPLSNTAPADNVEDVLRSVSDLVSGGGLNTLQDTVVKVNKAFPKDPAELDRIRGKVAGALNDLAANQATIDQILTSTRLISEGLLANTDTFDRLITEGPAKLEGLGNVTLNIVETVTSLSRLVSDVGPIVDPNAVDIIQILSHVTPFVGAAATADTTIPTIMDKINQLIRNKLIGFFRKGGPRFTVSGLHNPDGSIGLDPAARADQTISMMETMGLLRP
jgi:phospholipid/cholesterol/gamma-HCH transport system substrate-binding protein